MNKKKKIEPESEEDFSSDIRVMAKIYEYNKIKKESIWIARMYRCFRGKLSEGTVSRALHRLSDLGSIKSEWEKVNRRWVRCLFLTNHPEEFAKEMYYKIQEVKTCQKKEFV